MQCAPFSGRTFRLFPRFPLIRDGRTRAVRQQESWTSHAETSHSSRVKPFLSGVRVLAGALQTWTQKGRQRRSFRRRDFAGAAVQLFRNIHAHAHFCAPMTLSNSPGLIVRMPKRSAPRKSLRLKVTQSAIPFERLLPEYDHHRGRATWAATGNRPARAALGCTGTR
jgi:hypothetical protein